MQIAGYSRFKPTVLSFGIASYRIAKKRIENSTV